MANAVAGDVYLVTAVGSLFNQMTMTTFYYRLSNIPAGPTPTVEDLYLAFTIKLNSLSDLMPRLRAACPSNWVQTAIWVQRIWPVRQIKSITLTPGAPGLRAPTEVTNIQSSITRKTEVAQRHGIGGIRIPLTPADVDDGRITASLSGVLTLLAQQMLVLYDLTGDGIGVLEPVLFGRLKPPATGVRITPLFVTEVQSTSRVIRRRTVGLGI